MEKLSVFESYFHTYGQLSVILKATMKALFLLLFAATMLYADEKPNIVLIYADDLGYGDVFSYNKDRGKITTPHIDKFAAQGMRFTDAHSSSGVCSPSRYTLLTGRYHWRGPLQKGIVGMWEPPAIPPARMTIASLAKHNGYRTACIGKWHLGWDWPIPRGKRNLMSGSKEKDIPATEVQKAFWKELFSQPIPGGPTARGFDLYFGTDVPNWPPFCFIENDRTVGIPSEYLPVRLFKNHLASNQGPSLAGWKMEPILPAIADRAAAYITASAKMQEPFLLYFSLTSPHTPLSVNEEWVGKSGLGPYGDLVMETDAIVGRVLAALEESGEADNTLVIFTSDNGCAHYIGKDKLEAQGHFPSGPLRGAKSDAWEGGHRLPFIVRWPGVVKAGAVNDHLVHQADLLRTFADVIGAELPDNAGEDSFSLLPLLKGGKDPVRKHAVSNSASGIPAVRNGHWKYIAAPGSGGWGQGGDQTQPVQLYNLSEDLGETNNLAAAMPEKLAEMKVLYETIITEGRSTPGPKQPNDIEVTRDPK